MLSVFLGLHGLLIGVARPILKTISLKYFLHSSINLRVKLGGNSNLILISLILSKSIATVLSKYNIRPLNKSKSTKFPKIIFLFKLLFVFININSPSSSFAVEYGIF